MKRSSCAGSFATHHANLGLNVKFVQSMKSNVVYLDGSCDVKERAMNDEDAVGSERSVHDLTYSKPQINL